MSDAGGKSDDAVLSKREIFHKIRNCIGPIQAFLDVIELEDDRLKEFHQRCKNSFSYLKDLLTRLERS